MPLARTRFDKFKLRGLVAATFTPFRADGSVNYPRIKPQINQLIADGVAGLYVLGSTGEGPLLTTEERLKVAEASVKAAAGRVPVVVQVGHNSVVEASGFAAHAQAIGADAISSTPASYFKPTSLDNLLDGVAEIAAAAPKLPFYYYNIPGLNGVRYDMEQLLRRGGPRIPTLRGVKFSDTMLSELQACVECDGGKYDIVFGCDEMLLSGLVVGVQGAVGSQYNFAAPHYRRIIAAYNRSDMAEARRLQFLAGELVRVIVASHGGGRGGFKTVMKLIGQDCGPSRLPIATSTPAETARLRRDLTRFGFFKWGRR